MGTIYDWLDEMEQRPNMYFGRLQDLEKMLFGYLAALDMHRIDEGVPHFKHFASWLHFHTGWSTSCGWGDAFHENAKPAEKAVEAFFATLRKFRQLRPEVEARVCLGERHQPTGRRIVIGYDGRVARPASVDVVRYAPEPLHFFVFRYEDRFEVRHMLEVNRADGSLDRATTLQDAKAWIGAEFQVAPQEWVPPE